MLFNHTHKSTDKFLDDRTADKDDKQLLVTELTVRHNKQCCYSLQRVLENNRALIPYQTVDRDRTV